MQTLVVSHQQQRKLHEAGNDHERVTDITRQTKEHLEFDPERQGRVPDTAVELEPNLQHAFGPAALLCLEGINLDRNFRRRLFVQQINEPPAHQLRAKTQVGVFCKRVVLPTAAHLNRFASPDAGRAVKVEKIPAAISRGLLHHKVAVKHDCLQTRQQSVGTVYVGPTHLRAADRSFGEEMDQLAQEIRLRHKVGVEDCNQFALRCLHAVLKRARFEAGPILSMDIRNVEPRARISLYRGARNVHRFVSRIIQYLDLQTLAGIINLRHRSHQTLDHVHLVEERQLNGNRRQFAFRETALGFWRKLRIAPKFGYQLDAINTIDREDAEYREINDQHRPIECVQLIK